MPDSAQFPVVVMDEGLIVFVPETNGPLAEEPRFQRSLAGAQLNVAVALSHVDVPAAVVRSRMPGCGLRWRLACGAALPETGRLWTARSS